jgi:protein-S-isoprenylcysteine O-methyltransferase Ste14
MYRFAAILYGLFAYALFLFVFLYLVGFVGNSFVPKTIDTGPETPIGVAVLINSLLLGLFAVQHSIMARPWFKVWWCRFVPRPIERSTFVLITSLIFVLLVWQWRPIPTRIWHVDQPVLHAMLAGLSVAGWLLVLYSSFLIDHFDLFGLRQVYLYLRGRKYTHPVFVER